MYYRCELLIGGYVYPVTGFVKNWEDIKVSFKRNDYDGVVRTFSDNFEFVKGARTLLLNEYYNNYLNASASIVIYTRNNSWIWTEVFRCALNYSTLKDDGYVLSMNAIDNSVASLIKAKKGTQYEYSVNEVKDSIQLRYDGMEMTNNVVMTMPPNNSDTDTLDIIMEENGYYTIPLYVETSEIVRKGELELTDQMENFYNGADWIAANDVHFFKNESKQSLLVRIQMKFDAFYNSTNPERNDEFYIDGLAKGKLPLPYYHYKFPTPTFTSSVDVDVLAVVPPSFAIRMYLFSQYGKSAVRISNVSLKPTITWTSRRDSVNLDVIKPVTLLNRLLKSMNGGVDELTGVIVPSGEKRLDNAMLLAAESARQMPNAKIYTSFTKFCDWMKAVFGYVYDINGNTITFRHRDDYFGNNVVKTIENYTGYTMNINSSLIYSQVRIGYEKQDYNSVNGKDEFRFTNEYTTGITITDNKLELISPYRADAYGIEFLAEKIGEDTTDNESDTDVFFVCAYSDGDKYKLDRSILIQGVISPETMFNVMYAPSTFIFSNFSFLGSFISEMTFASSEGNTSVKIAQNAENRNIQINQKLFSVSQVEIETSDIELPKDLGGIVELTHQGRLIQGYYISADYTYTKSQSSKITLVIK